MSRAIDTYKMFIDSLVALAKQESPTSFGVSRGKVFELPTQEEQAINDYARELSPEQKQIVIRLIQDEHQTIIAEVLYLLKHDGYHLVKGGIEVAEEPFRAENYYDFIARLAGSEWPDQQGQASPS